MDDFLTLSRQRYTAKHYDGSRTIPPEDLDRLLEIVRLAPTAVNAQAWKFIVGSRKSRELVLPAIPDFNRARLENCSHFIVMCAAASLDEAAYARVTAREDADGRYPGRPEIRDAVDGHRLAFGRMHEKQGDYAQWTAKQVYIALAALLYGARSLGIDSTPMEGLDFDRLDEILKLRERNLRTVVMVALGYGAPRDSNRDRPKSRLPREELFEFLD